MTALLVPPLLTLALLSGWVANRRLSGARWPRHDPGTAVLTWHALAVACVGALLTAAALLAHDVLEVGLRLLSGADRDRLHAVYFAGRDTVDPRWNLAVVPVLLLLGLLAVGAVRTLRQAARTRRSVEAALVGAPGCRRDGVATVESSQLFAFSTPAAVLGRGGGHVVVSSALRQCLGAEQVAAVVAHETAHHERRHHRSVALAAVVTGALAWCGGLGGYARSVGELVEMQADDDAVRATSRRHVASALLMMSAAPRPGLSMAATPAGTASRVRRLLGVGPTGRPTGARRRGRTALTVAFVAALVPPACLLAPLALLP